jgi:hypothetical protein
MLIDMLMVVPLAGAVALMGIVISEIISIHQKNVRDLHSNIRDYIYTSEKCKRSPTHVLFINPIEI